MRPRHRASRSLSPVLRRGFPDISRLARVSSADGALPFQTYFGTLGGPQARRTRTAPSRWPPTESSQIASPCQALAMTALPS